MVKRQKYPLSLQYPFLILLCFWLSPWSSLTLARARGGRHAGARVVGGVRRTGWSAASARAGRRAACSRCVGADGGGGKRAGTREPTAGGAARARGRGR